MLITPVAPLIAINVDDATIIRSQPELNRVVFRDCDESSHVNHKQIKCAIQIRFAVVVAIDVVLYLRTTDWIFGGGSDWRNLVNGVVGRVQPW